MKPELSERLFIESLFENSKKKINESDLILDNVERLTGDASTRRYYRLETSNKTYVACIDNPSETNSNPFVTMQSFLEKHEVRVPKIYDIKLKRGYILEEDLGDVTLLQHLASISTVAEEFEIYKRVINSLLKMHRINISKITEEKIFKNSFDSDKLNSEIQFTTDFYMRRFLKIEDDSVLRAVETLFDPVCKRASSEKMVYTHRDFHSRNIMVKDDELIIIDFQDARWGIPQYDLVSMLEDCYYAIAPSNKEKLKNYYFDQLGQEVHGQNSYEHFSEIYDDMALQRVFKAIGSFSYIYETRKDVRYIKYIGFAMEKIKLILMKNEKYADLRKILFKYYYAS